MNEVLLEADRLEHQGNPLGMVLRASRVIETYGDGDHQINHHGYGFGIGYGVMDGDGISGPSADDHGGGAAMPYGWGLITKDSGLPASDHPKM